MDIGTYYRDVFVPANSAVSAMRRVGLPIHEGRAKARMALWQRELEELERYVEGEAAKKGFVFRYSPQHAPKPDLVLRDFLYSPQGLNLEVTKWTDPEHGEPKPSTDDEALLRHAAVGVNHNQLNGQPCIDHPVIYAILKIRSIAKARGTHLGGLLAARRMDGCAHAKFNYPENTTRLSAEDPPVHQLPEKADPEVAKLVKECIVPRRDAWVGDPAEWDPRKHGWCAKVDVRGAEMVVRAGAIARCAVLAPYLREGKDVHGKTAAAFYRQQESAFSKSDPRRNVVGKQSNFLLIFGGSWAALQQTLWKLGRMWFDKTESQQFHRVFFTTYPDLARRYEIDTGLMVQRGYIEDPYGRRWHMPIPPEYTAVQRNGVWSFSFIRKTSVDEAKALDRLLGYRRHCYANRPTQAAQGTTTLWGIALCHHGEYVPLQVPSYWQRYGVPFPQAAGWQLNEGDGPGGKPFQVWTTNTVHDSLWVDGAPGTLEPALQVVYRRFMGVPADFLLAADMPWRVEAEVGPDLGHLRPYNDVAKQFGLESMPEW